MNKIVKYLMLIFLFSWYGEVMAFSLTSSAFQADGLIPQKYTCDGLDISPPLAWKDAPPNTQSFALIFDDPDAPVGTWDHWILYNMPSTLTQLSENAKLPADVKE